MGLEAIASGIEDDRAGKPTAFLAIQFLPKEPWEVYEKMDIPFRRGVGISSGVAVCATKTTTLGDVNGMGPLEAAEGSWGEHPIFLRPLPHA
jgi:hypothetical protein